MGKLLNILITSLCIMMMSSVVVFADDVLINKRADGTELTQKDIDRLTEYFRDNPDKISKYLSDGGIASYKFEIDNLQIEEDTSNPGEYLTKNYYLVGDYTPDKIIDISMGLSGVNIRTPQIDPRLDSGTAIVGSVTDIVNIIISILVAITCIGMTVFTAFDVCYITMPVFRQNYDARHPDSSESLKVVSDEARYAVSHSIYSGNGTSNPLTIYLKSRILTYILVAVMLFLLLSGNLKIIVTFVMNLISGIIGILYKL